MPDTRRMMTQERRMPVMELNQIYNPLTAAPFACNEYYMEFAPCAALKPYIKCFWGTKKPVRFLKSEIGRAHV